MLMTYVTLMLIRDRDRVHWLVVVIAFAGLLRGEGRHLRPDWRQRKQRARSRRLFHRGPQLDRPGPADDGPPLWYIRLQLKVAWQRPGSALPRPSSP